MPNTIPGERIPDSADQPPHKFPDLDAGIDLDVGSDLDGDETEGDDCPSL